MGLKQAVVGALALAALGVAWVVAAPPEVAPVPQAQPAPLVQPADGAWRVEHLPFACQGSTCDGELWLPQGVSRPPVIVMAHGFGALRQWGLPPFAERFARAGFAVFMFDYRGFGASGGLPRQVVDGQEHVKDWLDAVDLMASHPAVDGQRLAVWGTSYSGGAVLVVAAQRPGVVKAVSSQVPFVSGWQSSLNYPLRYQPVATWYALHDGLRQLVHGASRTPVYAPVVAEQGFSALNCPECATGYRLLVPPGNEARNQVAARVFLTLPLYEPGQRAGEIQAPVLIIGAERDGLIPIKGVREVAQRLRQGEYVELPGADHFAPYTGALFDQVSGRQLAFFKKVLMP